MTPNNKLPDADNPVELRQAVLDHMHVGMTNHTILAEEGGPLLMASAEGINITDIEGNTYIDGISGMYFRNVGHGRNEIAEAVYEQLKTISMNVYSGARVASLASTMSLK